MSSNKWMAILVGTVALVLSVVAVAVEQQNATTQSTTTAGQAQQPGHMAPGVPSTPTNTTTPSIHGSTPNITTMQSDTDKASSTKSSAIKPSSSNKLKTNSKPKSKILEALQASAPTSTDTQSTTTTSTSSSTSATSGAKMDSGEFLLVVIPDNWKEDFRDQSKKSLITEYVPQSQTVQDWTSMITVQIFYNARSSNPIEFLDNVSSRSQKVCKDFSVVESHSEIQNGYPISTSLQACGTYTKTGQGEVTMYKVVQGNDSLYVVQRAWRGNSFTGANIPLSKTELMEWEKYLNAVTVCDTRSSLHTCPR